MSRVESLASQEVETESQTDEFGVRWIKHKEGKRPPYVMMVPLFEILAEAMEAGVGSEKVQGAYEQLVASFGGEFKVLLETSVEEIKKVVGERIAEGVSKVRIGNIVIEPGYDGVYGKVAIWKEEKDKSEETSQGALFG
jgi:PHP family Zn ribbon phosphoesterase